MAGPLPDGLSVPDDGVLPYSARTGAASRTFSAYLHIPFCSHRCGYCDFNTYTASELRGLTREGYLGALDAELSFARQVLEQSGVPERPLTSVFFGGGTPTLLPASALTNTLQKVRDVYGITAGAEVTVEANPDTLSETYLSDLAAGGVTRVSVGMQSAVPHVLNTLERTHNPANVSSAVQWAKAAGLEVSVDLIYGTPGESLDDWRYTLEKVSALDLNHISAYSLIVEEGTAMARKIRSGDVVEPDPDLQADMYECADEAFAAQGLSWYEISNWSRNNSTRSVHNRAYWTGQDWWGFGPGAHSHIGGVRFWNAKHPAAYADRVMRGITPAVGREILTDHQRETERILLESRLSDGLDIATLEPLVIDNLIADELCDASGSKDRLILTRSGRLRADEVARRLIVD